MKTKSKDNESHAQIENELSPQETEQIENWAASIFDACVKRSEQIVNSYQDELDNAIYAYIRKQRSHHHRIVVFKEASIVLILCIFLFSVLLINVEAVREPIIRLIKSLDGRSSLVVTDNREKYAETLDGHVYPDYVPYGYIIDTIYHDNNVFEITYANDASNYIDYTCAQENADKVLEDIEKRNYEPIKINDMEGTISTKGDNIILIFGDNSHIFSLRGKISRTELVKMAESIKIK